MNVLQFFLRCFSQYFLRRSKRVTPLRAPLHAPRLAVLLAATLLHAPRIWAHGAELALSASAPAGPLKLSAAQEQALGLQSVSADFRALDRLLDVNGELRLQPDRQVTVSSRIAGQLQALHVRLGDTVAAGQRLARVQSRLVGEPPPSVELSAPMAGIVDTIDVGIGQAVEPGTALLHLSDRRRLDFIARVYEEDLGKIRRGLHARLRMLSAPERVWSGSVDIVDPNLDAATRTSAVWIAVDNADGFLKPHMYGRASLVLQHEAAVLAIPTAAIVSANGAQFVFVHEGDVYRRVLIRRGAQDDRYSEISDGLVPGDEVVTQGVRELYTLWLSGGAAPADDD